MVRKIVSLLAVAGLLLQQTGFAQVAGRGAPAPVLDAGGRPDSFRPVHLRYLSYDNLKDTVRIILDKGDTKEAGLPELQEQSKDLLRYFLTGVSLPDNTFWVNLRPDSPDNIIDPFLEKTDVGRILLEADVQLKKDTALLTSPRTKEGREYWNKLYKKASELYGKEKTEIPTLTRPWIVPGEIIVKETPGSALVYKAGLKIMLEQDRLQGGTAFTFQDARDKELNEYSSQLIRELVIPRLTKEINSARRYAALRQVYFSLILSRWFKQRFAGKSGVYASRINSGELTGIYSKENWSRTDYFERYRQSFTNGEYDIKEQVTTPTGQVIRRYVSGGIVMDGGAMNVNNGFAAAMDNAEIYGKVLETSATVPQHIQFAEVTAARRDGGNSIFPSVVVVWDSFNAEMSSVEEQFYPAEQQRIREWIDAIGLPVRILQFIDTLSKHPSQIITTVIELVIPGGLYIQTTIGTRVRTTIGTKEEIRNYIDNNQVDGLIDAVSASQVEKFKKECAPHLIKPRATKDGGRRSSQNSGVNIPQTVRVDDKLIDLNTFFSPEQVDSITQWITILKSPVEEILVTKKHERIGHHRYDSTTISLRLNSRRFLSKIKVKIGGTDGKGQPYILPVPVSADNKRISPSWIKDEFTSTDVQKIDQWINSIGVAPNNILLTSNGWEVDESGDNWIGEISVYMDYSGKVPNVLIGKAACLIPITADPTSTSNQIHNAKSKSIIFDPANNQDEINSLKQKMSGISYFTFPKIVYSHTADPSGKLANLQPFDAYTKASILQIIEEIGLPADHIEVSLVTTEAYDTFDSYWTPYTAPETYTLRVALVFLAKDGKALYLNSDYPATTDYSAAIAIPSKGALVFDRYSWSLDSLKRDLKLYGIEKGATDKDGGKVTYMGDAVGKYTVENSNLPLRVMYLRNGQNMHEVEIFLNPEYSPQELARYVLHEVYNRLTVFGAEEVVIDVEQAIYDEFIRLFNTPIEQGRGYFSLGSFMNLVYGFQGERSFRIRKAAGGELNSLSAKVPEYAPVPRDFQKTLRSGNYIGLDIGGSDIKIVVLNNGKVVYSYKEKWKPADFASAADPIGYMHKLTDQALEAAMRQNIRISAMGISFNLAVVDNRPTGPGPVVEKLSGPEVEIVKGIAPMLAKEYKLPVFVLNDGDAGALWSNIHQMRPHTLALSLGTGLAGGYVDGNRQLCDYLAELGNVVLSLEDGALGHSFSKIPGASQRYLSQRLAFSMAKDAGIDLEGYEKDADKLSHLQDLYDSGDQKVKEIFGKLARYLAEHIIYISTILPVENVCLFGRVMSRDSGKYVLSELTRVLEEKSVPITITAPEEAVVEFAQAEAAAIYAGSNTAQTGSITSRDGGQKDAPGGIDFTMLPMTVRPMGNFSGLSVPAIDRDQLARVDIASETAKIKKLVDSGIMPAEDRVNTLVAACLQQRQLHRHAGTLLQCLTAMMKQQEENVRETTPGFRHVLMIVDSQ